MRENVRCRENILDIGEMVGGNNSGTAENVSDTVERERERTSETMQKYQTESISLQRERFREKIIVKKYDIREYDRYQKGKHPVLEKSHPIPERRCIR